MPPDTDPQFPPELLLAEEEEQLQLLLLPLLLPQELDELPLLCSPALCPYTTGPINRHPTQIVTTNPNPLKSARRPHVRFCSIVIVRPLVVATFL